MNAARASRPPAAGGAAATRAAAAEDTRSGIKDAASGMRGTPEADARLRPRFMGRGSWEGWSWQGLLTARDFKKLSRRKSGDS